MPSGGVPRPDGRAELVDRLARLAQRVEDLRQALVGPAQSCSWLRTSARRSRAVP